MTSGFIQDCAQWARAFQAAAGEIQESVLEGEDKHIHTFSIRFDSGHVIQTFSSNPRNLRSKGRPGERLVIDEAAFVDDLAELLKSAMAMTMWGGRVHMISTHNGEENPFNQLVNDIRAERYDYGLHRVTLDEALTDGLYRRICQVTGERWTEEGERQWRQKLVNRYRPNEQEELFCVPSMGGGAYFSRMLIEPNMAPAPVLRFAGDRAFNEAPEPSRRAQMDDWIRDELLPVLDTLDRERRHAFGMDFARSGDLSVIAPMEIGQALHRTVPLLVELRNVPHKQQEQVLFAIVDRLPRPAGGKIDAGGNGSYIAESAHDRYGSRIEQVKFTEGWYRDHMPPYKAAFEDRTITLPQDDDVLEDHRAFRLVRGVARLPDGKTDKNRSRHGDAAVACALAHAASRDNNVSLEWTPGPDKASRWGGDEPDDDTLADLPELEAGGW